MRALWITLAAVLLADQASKVFVLERLHLDERLFLEVLPPWINFTMAWNTGVNFGLFGDLDMKWMLIGLALVVCLAVLWWIIRDRAGALAQICAGLLVGGALGNVIDRLRFGAVVDFLNVSCCGIDNPYAFNIADMAIFVGAVGLVFFAPSGGRGPKQRKGA